MKAYKAFGPDWKCRDMQYEQWRPVIGFVGLYEVSSLGRIKSMPRKTKSGVLGGELLSPCCTSNGYLRVTLSGDGERLRKSLHRIVLEAFVGDCPPNHECRHLDGIRSNCSLTNLTWGTKSQNAIDRIRHGTHVNNQGERHGMTHLRDAQAIEIVRLRNGGMPQKTLAAMFSISQSTVSRITTQKSWRHITDYGAK